MSRTAALLAALLLAAPAPAPAPSADPSPGTATEPRIQLPEGTLRVGDQVLVTLSGWPAGTVQVEVCGNAGRRGALDCAADGATPGQVPVSGAATLPMVLTAPPVACPCLLRARTPTGTAAATLDLPLTGVTAPAVTAETRPEGLNLVALDAADRSGPGGWFGLPGELTVQLRLHNPGSVDVVDPPFSLLVGPPDRVRTIVAAPALGTVAAGQTRDYSFTVPVDVATLGRYEVHGRIEPPGPPVVFAVEDTRHPWGLLAVVGLLLLPLVARLRRRPAPGSAPAEPARPSRIS
ncbi:hypothetical protein ABT336_22835 [Micromonospora sp. NPDC000207]|uniref:hypothetical protein n=1 Tax=Micromonospora sp. NPDC000207 TaxID=3154246 RepID=UPI00331A498D